MPTYQQGVVTDGITTTYGLVQRITRSNQVTIAEAPDENGEVASATQFNPVRTVDFEFIHDVSVACPDLSAARTTPVTLAYDQDGSDGSGSSENYLVETADETEVNTEYRKLAIKARRYLANSIPS